MGKISIKKNDTVMVIAGKERGKSGKVLKVLPKKNAVIIERLNFVKRHLRPGAGHGQGGIVEKEAPIHISNVQLLCGKCNLPTRIGKKILEDGRKIRICKKCGEAIDE
ncbi:MAG: 50S ribosomal protein L24 [Deltaproteobacteria bacterium]|nr:MAG: 50S ribosomal protein L24 [Deltaproteobacteria bacterium]